VPHPGVRRGPLAPSLPGHGDEAAKASLQQCVEMAQQSRTQDGDFSSSSGGRRGPCPCAAANRCSALLADGEDFTKKKKLVRRVLPKCVSFADRDDRRRGQIFLKRP
jgi:hypothetical protein